MDYFGKTFKKWKGCTVNRENFTPRAISPDQRCHQGIAARAFCFARRDQSADLHWRESTLLFLGIESETAGSHRNLPPFQWFQSLQLEDRKRAEKKRNQQAIQLQKKRGFVFQAQIILWLKNQGKRPFDAMWLLKVANLLAAVFINRFHGSKIAICPAWNKRKKGLKWAADGSKTSDRRILWENRLKAVWQRQWFIYFCM